MSISVVGIVGAGFMGSGIAESSAVAGKQVFLYEPEEAPLARSRAHIDQSLRRAVSRDKLTQEDAAGVLDRIVYTTRFEDLSEANAVIEAVSEDARLKAEVCARIDSELPKAQPTPRFDPRARLQTRRPGRVLGPPLLLSCAGDGPRRGRGGA